MNDVKNHDASSALRVIFWLSKIRLKFNVIIYYLIFKM